jgi:hypothetical protein
METQSHLPEFNRALEVLNSCQSPEHIKGAIRYFSLFIQKWRSHLTSKTADDLIIDFETELTFKLIRIKKEEIEIGH